MTKTRAPRAERGGRAQPQRRAQGAARTPPRTDPASRMLDLQSSHGNNWVLAMLGGGPIQRKCGCGGSCCAGEDEFLRLQRSAAGPAPAAVPPIQRSSTGSPLPSSTAASMGSSFGHDFSNVRVHTDSGAAGMAQSLNANAFTSGPDIYFARGQYQPGTTAGRGLLAHELTHVVQQRAGRSPAGIDTPGDVYEREADAAAASVLRGEPVRLGLAGPPPTIQRQAPSGPAATLGAIVVLPPAGFSPDRYRLVIPGEKAISGADKAAILARYRAAANLGAVRTAHTIADRGGTDTLWNVWATSRGYASYEDVPGVRGGSNVPAGVTAHRFRDYCSPDHLIEAQLGGPDRGENLRLLERDRNRNLGSRLDGVIDRIRANLRADVPSTPANAVLQWPGDLIDMETSVGGDDCAEYDRAVSGTGAAARTAAPGAAQLTATIAGVTLQIGFRDSGAVHPHSRYVVPGFELREVVLVGGAIPTAAPFTIRAQISERARIPFLPANERRRIFNLQVDASGVLSAAPAEANLRLAFPFLSEAELPLTLEGGKLHAEGTFRPTLPVLRNVDVNLVIDEDRLSGGVSVPPDKLKEALPIPGLEVTDATLSLAFAEGRFRATGGFGIRYQTVADGRVEASFEGGQFRARGVLNFHIPGIDQATGEIWLREGRLGGRVTIGADKLRFPGVRSANLVVTIEDGALQGTGTLQLSIPGIRTARLGFGIDREGNYSITGSADLQIPGTRSATVELAYRDGDLQGRATVGLDIPGLESATVEVVYQHGQLTGSASISYRRGRLSGTVNVRLSERNKLSGGGELAYEIAPGLVAFAGMQIDEEGHTRISGGLRVPETIDLFERRQVEKELFRFPTIEIPIFAIPLGTRSVGLVATIGGRLVARAGIGPGQLRRVQILGEFDPSSDEAAFSFQASAELYIPANAEIALSAFGGLGLSLAIARATGGIEAEGAAGLQAEFIAATTLSYQNGQFAVEGRAELAAQPKLIFRLRAYVAVEIDLWITTIEVYRKEWLLAQIEAGSSLRVGVRIPFRYVFGQPFEFNVDQIEFIVPEINILDTVKELLPM